MTQVDLLKIQLIAMELRGGTLDRAAYFGLSLIAQYTALSVATFFLGVDLWLAWVAPHVSVETFVSEHQLATLTVTDLQVRTGVIAVAVVLAIAAVLLVAFAGVIHRSRRRRKRMNQLCERILALKWNVTTEQAQAPRAA